MKTLSIVCLLVLTSCGSPTIGDRGQPSSHVAASTLPATPQPITTTPTTQPDPPTITATRTPLEPRESTTSTATADDTGDWQSYTSESGGYSLGIPADWGVTGEPSASVQFFDQEAANLEDLSTGEPEFFAGGVDILGFIASEPDPYQVVLPNQSAIVEMQPIETPLGEGRVYTLRRDRFRPREGETVWYAQHALIPVDDRIYEVWINVDSATNGDPAPILRRMVAEFKLGSGQ